MKWMKLIGEMCDGMVEECITFLIYARHLISGEVDDVAPIEDVLAL